MCLTGPGHVNWLVRTLLSRGVFQSVAMIQNHMTKQESCRQPFEEEGSGGDW